MISIGRLITNTPIPVVRDIKFYQPTIAQILDMGEEMYWSLLKVWDLTRKDLIKEETEESLKYNDFEIWKTCLFLSPPLQERVKSSVDCFLHTKIEFLPMSNTIVVGERETSTLLDETFCLVMRDISRSLSALGSSEKEEQYKETDNMSAREREIMEKMRKSAEMLDKIKNGDQKVEDRLVKQVVSLVAIGHYTFEEVLQFTIVQMIYLLKKYVDVQQYELRTMLSPYTDSKKTQPVKHWLET